MVRGGSSPLGRTLESPALRGFFLISVGHDRLDRQPSRRDNSRGYARPLRPRLLEDFTRMPSRRFRSRQRVAFFLVARGRCRDCGTELEPGWHADHISPIRVGGVTESANGQALCPACNLRKGGHERGS